MEKIKTGVIGCGKVGEFHAHCYAALEQSEFTACYDADAARAQALAEKYGGRPATGMEEMANMGVQAVSVCAPHPLHAAAAVPALKAGMHVLVEKPLASTLADCDLILETAKKMDRTVGTVCQRRFYAPSLRLRRAIDDGKIGMPILGMVHMLGWRDEAYYKSDPWRGTWRGEGGGVLVNQAPHQLDLLLWYMGDVTEVYGIEANLNHPYIEVEDTAVAVVRFKSGALGNIVVSNSQNPALYGKVHILGSNGAGVGVQTDGGSMFIAGMSSIAEPPVNDLWTVAGEEGLLEGWKQQDSKYFASIDSTYHYHQQQIGNFLRSLAGEEPLLVTGEDGRKTVELFTAIYRATQTGQPVHFPLQAQPEDDTRCTAQRQDL